MVAYVYKPRRRDPEGKLIVSPLYRARFRLQGEYKQYEVALNTTDRQVAEKKLAEIIADPRLTANIYTDVTQLPTFSAVNALPWHNITSHPADAVAKAKIAPENDNTATAPQTVDILSPNQAHAVTNAQNKKLSENPHPKGFQHVITQFAKRRKLERATGLEDTARQPEDSLNEWDAEEIPAPIAATAPPGPGKMVEVAGVEPACP